jgi:hypothetical protein
MRTVCAATMGSVWMKWHVMLTAAALAVAAGPAAAEGLGWGGHGPKRLEPEHFAPLPRSPAYAPTQAPATPRTTYGTPPAAEGFKPYEPFRGGSVYSQPRRTYGGTSGAKDCELSVYVNACGSRR